MLEVNGTAETDGNDAAEVQEGRSAIALVPILFTSESFAEHCFAQY